jgi:hypothetical protein
MAKKPLAPKPRTAPEHAHAIMSEAEQAKYLGLQNEVVTNLGHASREDDLTRNPLGKVVNYDSADTARTFRDPARLQGTYRTCGDPRSGISSAGNLDKWADYATKDSYTGHGNKAGTGRPVSMPDPRGRRDEGSDEYLLRPDWSKYEYGADSGPGRLEKSGKR